jgi:F-type H+-transporting ATPase subunit epsilon
LTMATFHFDFVGPERTLYSGEVEAVQLPGSEGEMTPTLRVVSTGAWPGSTVISPSEPGSCTASTSPESVLAERAAPIEEVTPGMIDREIEAVELVRDATQDLAKREALNAQIVQTRAQKQKRRRFPSAFRISKL